MQLNSEWAKANREKLRPQRAKYMQEWRARKKLEAAERAKISEPQAPVVPAPGDENKTPEPDKS